MSEPRTTDGVVGAMFVQLEAVIVCLVVAYGACQAMRAFRARDRLRYARECADGDAGVDVRAPAPAAPAARPRALVGLAALGANEANDDDDPPPYVLVQERGV